MEAPAGSSRNIQRSVRSGDLLPPPDESMQKCFAEGSGPLYRDVLSWLQSSNTQLQLSGALAIANFARNGEEQGCLIDHRSSRSARSSRRPSPGSPREPRGRVETRTDS